MNLASLSYTAIRLAELQGVRRRVLLRLKGECRSLKIRSRGYTKRALLLSASLAGIEAASFSAMFSLGTRRAKQSLDAASLFYGWAASLLSIFSPSTVASRLSTTEPSRFVNLTVAVPVSLVPDRVAIPSTWRTCPFDNSVSSFGPPALSQFGLHASKPAWHVFVLLHFAAPFTDRKYRDRKRQADHVYRECICARKVFFWRLCYQCRWNHGAPKSECH
jgi:hypothetical protein